MLREANRFLAGAAWGNAGDMSFVRRRPGGTRGRPHCARGGGPGDEPRHPCHYRNRQDTVLRIRRMAGGA